MNDEERQIARIEAELSPREDAPGNIGRRAFLGSAAAVAATAVGIETAFADDASASSASDDSEDAHSAAAEDDTSDAASEATFEVTEF